ncbi:hypothetical protein ATANTOWER_005924 [Ataeniobius toweri]|uniref:BED-type domain-containing protein n=1 Tax=Ataeniobius toweri TaxID=208326 RepID=A0ABU7C0C0_9TELE|nr:hypothetical protein [Ataeniobius toweri]
MQLFQQKSMSKFRAAGLCSLRGGHSVISTCLGKNNNRLYLCVPLMLSQSVTQTQWQSINGVMCGADSASQTAEVYVVCGKPVRSFGNSTNLVKHLRLNYNIYDEMDRSEDLSVRCCRASQTCLVESFSTAGRHCPGTEKTC